MPSCAGAPASPDSTTCGPAHGSPPEDNPPSVSIANPGDDVQTNEVPYELDVEIWPTSIVGPPGYRRVLTLKGCDFEYDVPGRMLHDDPRDRPPEIFGGTNRIHTGGTHPSYLLMPLIPT